MDEIPSSENEMSELAWASEQLHQRVAPPGGSRKERIRTAARRLDWNFSRAKAVWYADERIALKARELRRVFFELQSAGKVNRHQSTSDERGWEPGLGPPNAASSGSASASSGVRSVPMALRKWRKEQPTESAMPSKHKRKLSQGRLRIWLA